MKVTPINNNIQFKSKERNKEQCKTTTRNPTTSSFLNVLESIGRYLTHKTDTQSITFKNGVAYDKKGMPYTGEVLIRDKHEKNKRTLFYKNGLIMQSCLNGNVCKNYYRYNLGGNSVHVFSDGSKLEDSQFYDTNCARTTVVTGKDDVSEITQNENAQYKNEPIFYVRRYKKNNPEKFEEFKIVRPNGEERFEFSSLDKAKEYFMEEYGIEADFDSLAQAHIVKNAIDDFIKLNYGNEGKRIFEGLRIYTDDSEDKSYPATICPEHFVEWINPETNNKFESIKDEEEKIRFLRHNKPDIVELMDITLALNKNYNWQDGSIQKLKKINKTLSGNSIKHLIIHELGHTLHSYFCPYEYIIYTLPDTKRKAAIRSQVSEYAANNGSEFVAEYIAGRIEGKTYSPEVNKLYKEYSSMRLFG